MKYFVFSINSKFWVNKNIAGILKNKKNLLKSPTILGIKKPTSNMQNIPKYKFDKRSGIFLYFIIE